MDPRFRERLQTQAFRDFLHYWEQGPRSKGDAQLDEQAVVGGADSVIIPTKGLLTVERDLEEYIEAYRPGTRIFARHDPVSDQPRVVVTVPIEMPSAPPQGYSAYPVYNGSYQDSGAGKLKWLALAAFAAVSFAVLQTNNGTGVISVLLTGQ